MTTIENQSVEVVSLSHRALRYTALLLTHLNGIFNFVAYTKMFLLRKT